MAAGRKKQMFLDRDLSANNNQRMGTTCRRERPFDQQGGLNRMRARCNLVN